MKYKNEKYFSIFFLVVVLVVHAIVDSHPPQTTFKGRVFMTHPTKAIYKVLLTEHVKTNGSQLLYEENDVLSSMQKIEGIDYHQEVEVSIRNSKSTRNFDWMIFYFRVFLTQE